MSLLVVDRQREKIHPLARRFRGGGGCQDEGVTVPDGDGAAGLFREFAGFDGQGTTGDLTRYLGCLQSHNRTTSLVDGWGVVATDRCTGRR